MACVILKVEMDVNKKKKELNEESLFLSAYGRWSSLYSSNSFYFYYR
jgi:hypothetical protein